MIYADQTFLEICLQPIIGHSTAAAEYIDRGMSVFEAL